MKILFFSKDFPTLSQTFFDNQANSVFKENADVEVLKYNDVDSNGILDDGVKIKKIIPSENKKLPLSFLVFYYYIVLFFRGESDLNILLDRRLKTKQKLSILYMLVKKEKINADLFVVHFGDNAYFSIKLREFGVFSGKLAVVFHAHEITRYNMIKKYREIYLYSFEQCDYLLPISYLWKEKLTSMGCKPEKIHVIRMGVDLENYKFMPKNRDTIKPFKFIQVGRLTEKKGIFDTINAFIKIKDKMNFTLDIVGDGDLFDEALALVKTVGLGDVIKFHGKQPNSVVKKMLLSSDAYLLPSRIAKNGDMEGIPVALMEAMATGVPVISTYHSGIPELVENAFSGFLVEEGNVEQLSEAILDFSKCDEFRLKTIRLNAREKIEKDFNSKIEANKLVNLIEGNIKSF